MQLRLLSAVFVYPSLNLRPPDAGFKIKSSVMPSSTRKPHTILFFDHTAQMGGGEIALLHLVQHLDKQLFMPIVVLGGAGPLHQRLLDAGVETHLMPLPEGIAQTRKDSLGADSLLRLKDASKLLNYALRLSRFIRHRRVRLVHTNSLKADLIGGIASRLAGVPVIWHVRDRIANDYLPGDAARVFRWLCSWLPSFVVANSQSTMDTIFPPSSIPDSKALSVQKPPRQVLYSGVVLRWRHNDDVTTRLSTLEKRRWDRDETDSHKRHDDHEGLLVSRNGARDRVLDPRAPRIGIVGRISPWKGQHLFVHAAAEVRHDFPGATFYIIGAPLFGEELYEESVRRQASSYGLDDCLEWMGFRPDVPQLIDDLDILVHASTISEPFGQVIVQGMAAGKPVVATDGGGVREVVQHGETGLLVERNSSRALSQALVQLLSDPHAAYEMGREARRRVVRKFTIEHTARGAESIYHALLSNDLSQRD